MIFYAHIVAVAGVFSRRYQEEGLAVCMRITAAVGMDAGAEKDRAVERIGIDLVAMFMRAERDVLNFDENLPAEEALALQEMRLAQIRRLVALEKKSWTPHLDLLPSWVKDFGLSLTQQVVPGTSKSHPNSPSASDGPSETSSDSEPKTSTTTSESAADESPSNESGNC